MKQTQIEQELTHLRGLRERFARIVDALEKSPAIRAALSPEPELALPEVTSLVTSMAEIEKQAILNAVAVAGDAVGAAKLLGLGKTTVYRKLREYKQSQAFAPVGMSRAVAERVRARAA